MVVGGARDPRRGRVRARDRLVARGIRQPGGRRVCALLADDEYPAQLRYARRDLGHQRHELLVHDGDLGVGVVEQVAQLFLAVAIVDVGRNQRRLHRRVHALHVRGMVVCVDRDLALPRRPLREHPGADVARAPLQRLPGQMLAALHQRLALGTGRGDDIERVGQVVGHVCTMAGAALPPAARNASRALRLARTS